MYATDGGGTMDDASKGAVPVDSVEVLADMPTMDDDEMYGAMMQMSLLVAWYVVAKHRKIKWDYARLVDQIEAIGRSLGDNVRRKAGHETDHPRSDGAEVA